MNTPLDDEPSAAGAAILTAWHVMLAVAVYLTVDNGWLIAGLYVPITISWLVTMAIVGAKR